MNLRNTIQIAFCGPGEPTSEELKHAEEIGRMVGERGAILLSGGLGGTMEAASRGARQAGGHTIGILPGYHAYEANQWIDLAICTGMGQARNVILVASADVVIASGGGFGTLSEIAHAARLSKPVVLLGGWSPHLQSDSTSEMARQLDASLHVASSAEDAVNQAFVLSG